MWGSGLMGCEDQSLGVCGPKPQGEVAFRKFGLYFFAIKMGARCY